MFNLKTTFLFAQKWVVGACRKWNSMKSDKSVLFVFRLLQIFLGKSASWCIKLMLWQDVSPERIHLSGHHAFSAWFRPQRNFDILIGSQNLPGLLTILCTLHEHVSGPLTSASCFRCHKVSWLTSLRQRFLKCHIDEVISRMPFGFPVSLRLCKLWSKLRRTRCFIWKISPMKDSRAGHDFTQTFMNSQNN